MGVASYALVGAAIGSEICQLANFSKEDAKKIQANKMYRHLVC